MKRDWKSFWTGQDDPRHPKMPDFLLHHGREFALLGVNPVGKRVLELGCGPGSMFDIIGFGRAQSYRGVDFSETMLATFRATHRGVDVLCAEASGYMDESKYDLIFSNAVVQYFSAGMLARHLIRARAMLAPGGTIVVGSVPWRGARAAYHLQSYYPGNEPHLIRNLAVLARSYLGVDQIGHWHSYRVFARFAKKNRLTATYFGCVQYPYRFHARMDDTLQA
jgi:cyclopropane fatty-acyl-phospholipid synthase-like methyltransferase